VQIPFSSSPRSSLGVEWELELVDLETRELAQGRVASDILAELSAPHGEEHPKAKHELLESCVEIITGVCSSVADAERDLQATLTEVCAAAERRGLGVMCSGTHPFTDWQTQTVSPNPRYAKLIEDMQWLARRLQIFGVHVHVGVRSPEKAIPIVNALTAYIPHFLALSASSPYWIGTDTGLASARSKVFEGLPTAGLPYQLTGWDDFEDFMETLISAQTINTIREVWWDVRPHPNFGTVELRICDGLPTLHEIGWAAAVPVPRRDAEQPARQGLHTADTQGMDGAREQVARRALRHRRGDHPRRLRPHGAVARRSVRARRRPDAGRRPAGVRIGAVADQGDPRRRSAVRPATRGRRCQRWRPARGRRRADRGDARQRSDHGVVRVNARLDEFLETWRPHLVAFRRDLHAHPELGRLEVRTTEAVAELLRGVGLTPRPLPGGTGLLCDIGDAAATVGLRADLDALPLTDVKPVEYRSRNEGACHACGHDVHTTVVAGAGVFLARAAAEGLLDRGVRLIFQPAEELMPGGALDVIAAGGLDGLERLYAVHCDPAVTVGQVGLRVGAVTSATDHVTVRLTGAGGHTARPQLTGDLVTALGDLLVRVPAVLARRVDPRTGVNLTWGEAHAGTAANVIPRSGVVSGTLRMLDRQLWETVPGLLADLVHEVVAPYGVEAEVVQTRGVPPVVNDAVAIGELARAARAWVGRDAVTTTEQSLGGEDFGWMLEKVPGALARLGVRAPGSDTACDLHQAAFDVDEACLEVGVQLLVGAVLGTAP
jgi:amidohydrolase